jgi:DNA-binding XRE family transcriptional regulator
MTSVFDDPEKQEDDLETKEAIKHFTEALKQQRAEKKLSQLGLVKKAGVSQKVISEIETGGNFKMGTYIKVCRAMGIVPKVTFKKYRPNKPSPKNPRTSSL